MELFECKICGVKSHDEEDFDICNECGELVCIDCSDLINGEPICQKCVSKIIYEGIDDYY